MLARPAPKEQILPGTSQAARTARARRLWKEGHARVCPRVTSAHDLADGASPVAAKPPWPGEALRRLLSRAPTEGEGRWTRVRPGPFPEPSEAPDDQGQDSPRRPRARR